MDRVIQARFRSIEHFKKQYEHTIRDYNFAPGALVLVRNSQIELELNRKSKPRYLGPMVVIRRTRRGAYILAEPTGAISALRYAAFRVIPYHARFTLIPNIEDFVAKSKEELDALASNDKDEPERLSDEQRRTNTQKGSDDQEPISEEEEDDPPDLNPISDSDDPDHDDDPDNLRSDQEPDHISEATSDAE